MIARPIYQSATGAEVTEADIAEVAASMGVVVPALKAVLEVEANGAGFFQDDRLVMLPEPHILYRQLKDDTATRSKAVKAGVAYSKWGTKPYPVSVAARYELFNTMAQIAGMELAARSCSWGLPQMMGFNYKSCGYDSAVALVEDFATGEAAQLRGMASFIKANPRMHRAMVKCDWPVFAHAYNGPSYYVNRYDQKLAVAFAKYNKGVSHPLPVLREGDRGDAVRDMQERLHFAGYPVGMIDGRFGKLTSQALRSFQKDHGLTVDGIYGDKSRAALVKKED